MGRPGAHALLESSQTRELAFGIGKAAISYPDSWILMQSEQANKVRCS
ncbi:hypothetical protein FVEN_g12857 [Fusarium venenatum]|nr:hypothetical protein FVEN_g12857 [Fusarium venenatum]